ncbi:unnamed protein product [Prunus brigantina]
MGNSDVLAGNHPQQPRASNNNTCSAFSQTVPASHLGPILNVLAGLSEEQCKQVAAAMVNFPTPSPTPAQIHLPNPTTPTQSYLPDPTPLLHTHLPGPTPPPGSPIPPSSIPPLDTGPVFSSLSPSSPARVGPSSPPNPTVPTDAVPPFTANPFPPSPLDAQNPPPPHHSTRSMHPVGTMIILWASLLPPLTRHPPRGQLLLQVLVILYLILFPIIVFLLRIVLFLLTFQEPVSLPIMLKLLLIPIGNLP